MNIKGTQITSIRVEYYGKEVITIDLRKELKRIMGDSRRFEIHLNSDNRLEHPTIAMKCELPESELK